MSPFVLLHRLIRRLQQRNMIVGRSIETGLSLAESHFLVELDALNEVSVSELTSILTLDGSYVSRLASSMEERKIVSSFKDKSDSRKKILRLTQQGKSLIKKIDSSANNHYAQMAAHLSIQEVKSLVWLYKTVADGSGMPEVTVRPHESVYRTEQRRFTRSCGLLKDAIFGLPIAATSWQVLSEVTLAPTPPQVGELLELLSVAQNSLSSVVSSLVKKRLIKKSQGAKDARNVYLKATEEGKAVYERIEHTASKMFSSALAGVDNDKLTASITIFKKFLSDSCEGIAPLVPNYQIIRALKESEKSGARGLIAKTYVREHKENLLPASIASNSEETWMLACKDGCIGALDIRKNTENITAAGWDNEVTQWLFSRFLNEVTQGRTSSSSHQKQLTTSCEFLRERFPFLQQ